MRKSNLALVVIMILAACADTANKTVNAPASKGTVNSNLISKGIEGSWNLVWDSSGGRIRSGTITQFKMFHDGFFSLIMQDFNGKWLAGAGLYTLDGNIYKETFNYCTVPDYIGTTDWQDCELKGDTLYFKGFAKVLSAEGKDMSSNFPKFEEKRIRAK